MAKPAGIPTFPPHADPGGDCVLARLLAEQPERAAIPFPEGFAGGIAHRLDISTSGALLVADDPDELARIRAAFAERALTKTYRLRAAKSVPWAHNVCTAALAHDKRKKKRMIAQRGANTPHRGRWHAAETRFERLSGDVFAAVMRTGVMHQIRVHAAFVGIPLLGDRLYGGGPTPDGAPPGLVYYLHHVGLAGNGIATSPVPMPEWARTDSNEPSEVP